MERKQAASGEFIAPSDMELVDVVVDEPWTIADFRVVVVFEVVVFEVVELDFVTEIMGIKLVLVA